MPPFVDRDMSDRERLLEAPAFLTLVVQETFASGLVDGVLLPFLLAAWNEIQNAGELARLRDAIGNASDHTLARHGLVGANLEMKRRALGEWHRRFERKPDGRNLKRVLRGLRSLFGSLLDALGVGGLLKEFLDLLTEAIQEQGEDIAAI